MTSPLVSPPVERLNGMAFPPALERFGFPFHRLLPSHIIGIISIVVLGVVIVARYAGHLVGRWRRIYVVGAVLSLYFNFFVLIVQGFMKVPALKAVAPTQSEPPFVIAQVVALIMFIVFGIAGTIKFHPEELKERPT